MGSLSRAEGHIDIDPALYIRLGPTCDFWAS